MKRTQSADEITLLKKNKKPFTEDRNKDEYFLLPPRIYKNDASFLEKAINNNEISY